MGARMNKAPVYFVIGQVRFNTILALDSFIAGIQDAMRKDGYPDFQKSVQATFNIAFGPSSEGTIPQVPVNQAARYTFSDIEKMTGFILEQSALSFQTTEYETFEVFSEKLMKGLAILHDHVALNYSERIGLRYLDAVCPAKEETLTDYLQTCVLGLADKLDGDLVFSFSETRTNTLAAALISRVIIQTGKIGFPPDLQPMFLNLAKRFSTFDGRHGVIDTDGAFEIRERFDLPSVEKRLQSIHNEIDTSFRATVTDKALEIWK